MEPIDPAALAGALRSLGILYGARNPLATTIAGAADEAEAIRAYIRLERPHLLSTYDMETLVSLVIAARTTNSEAPTSIEQFNPD